MRDHRELKILNDIHNELVKQSSLLDKIASSGTMDQVLTVLNKQEGELQHMAVTLDDVLANAQDETTVDASIIALLNSISTQLAAAGQDPVKLAALNDVITKNKAAIVAAVTANTPAATPAP